MTIKKEKSPFLGCIADDFTGASDLASFLVASGMRTVQINSIPSLADLTQFRHFDAIVIALKSRTAPVKQAINESVAALEWLQEIGCSKFYFKYCSTFDSTAQGNIGPVTDALLDKLGASSTIICPALPVNGRTVYKGYLFVFDQPIHESPMKDHPLTPMHDSSLVRLIETQGTGTAVNIPYEDIEKGPAALTDALTEASQKGARYLVTDALKTEHLLTIGKSIKHFKLITGGSGLASDLTEEFEALGFVKSQASDVIKGQNAPTLVLSGSCSAMTQRQVTRYAANHPTLQLDAVRLSDQVQSIDSIMAWLEANIDQSPLIYSTASPDAVKHAQQTLGDQAAKLLEDTLSEVAFKATQMGVRNIVVAGGETSGAIVKKLSINAFQIGPSIAPGVPMVQTLTGDPLNLALKSGNFGQDTFFQQAVETLQCT